MCSVTSNRQLVRITMRDPATDLHAATDVSGGRSTERGVRPDRVGRKLEAPAHFAAAPVQAARHALLQPRNPVFHALQAIASRVCLIALAWFAATHHCVLEIELTQVAVGLIAWQPQL